MLVGLALRRRCRSRSSSSANATSERRTSTSWSGTSCSPGSVRARTRRLRPVRRGARAPAPPRSRSGSSSCRTPRTSSPTSSSFATSRRRSGSTSRAAPTFAWTGLMLGFVSLYLVHAVAKRPRASSPAGSSSSARSALQRRHLPRPRDRAGTAGTCSPSPAPLAQLHTHLDDPASLDPRRGVTLAIDLPARRRIPRLLRADGRRLETSRRESRDR